MYSKKPLQKFLDDLSSKLPAPGGGAAASLTGALGAALVSMVANFTVGNEKYKNVEAEIAPVLNMTESIRNKLTKLIQADVDAYSKFSIAYKLPKTTDKEKHSRQLAIESAAKDALEVPMQIAICCYEILKLCPILLEKGNPNLVSDVGCSAILANAGIKLAYLNVKINMSSITDEIFKRKKIKAIEFMLNDGEKFTRSLVNGTLNKIK
mgnify:CR=1 FL=1